MIALLVVILLTVAVSVTVLFILTLNAPWGYEPPSRLDEWDERRDG